MGGEEDPGLTGVRGEHEVQGFAGDAVEFDAAVGDQRDSGAAVGDGGADGPSFDGFSCAVEVVEASGGKS